MITNLVLAFVFVTNWAIPTLADDRPAMEISVDCSRSEGEFRPLHGVNSGPLHAGETLDLSAHYREVGVPLTRLHDCHWPNPDVVDMHVVFPDFRADPQRAESYDFRRTDAYIRSILASGSKVVYRLGESIEHSKRKYHVHPPADPQKWAAVCVGIIRHYNEGWAEGFRNNIRYWEIWNEPENRPAMWSGTDADYFRLYSAAAKTIKARFPDVRVGGPAVGNIGQTARETFEPSAFVRAFLGHCERDAAPLDFFSWHTYTSDPRELARRAEGVRRLLDDNGFAHTENHLNEWNYLPDNDWGPMLSSDALMRQRWFERIGGSEGAAFTTAAFLLLQDARLDAANFYSADIQGFGMFNEFGVPKKCFHAFRAFHWILDTPHRVGLDGTMPEGVSAAAGVGHDRSKVTILASNFSSAAVKLRLRAVALPWKCPTACEVLLLDARHNLEPTGPHALPEGILADQEMEARSVCVIMLRPSPAHF